MEPIAIVFATHLARRRIANRLTPTGTRLLAELRRQLLDPPTPLQRTKTDTPNQKSESVGAVAYHDNQGPRRSSFTPALGRNPRTLAPTVPLSARLHIGSSVGEP